MVATLYGIGEFHAIAINRESEGGKAQAPQALAQARATAGVGTPGRAGAIGEGGKRHPSPRLHLLDGDWTCSVRTTWDVLSDCE